MKSFKLYFPVFSLCISLTNCDFEKKTVNWEIAKIDSTIRKKSIYFELDKKEETFSAFEEKDSIMKKTSEVRYSIGREMNPGEYKNPQPNNCRAYLISPDSLIVDIGIGTGFGAHGITIKYAKKAFYTEPYYSTDILYVGESRPYYKNVYQKLTLDRLSYSKEVGCA